MVAKIIALEGCSGAGKTELWHRLAHPLCSRGISVACVREAEYEPMHTLVTEWRANPHFPFSLEQIEAFARARAEVYAHHLRSLAVDALLLDKYVHTSAVYQCSDSATPQYIFDLNIARGARPPDAVILLECDPDIAFARKEGRNAVTGGPSFYSISPERIRIIQSRYKPFLRDTPNMTLIDTTIGGIDEVVIKAAGVISRYFTGHR